MIMVRVLWSKLEVWVTVDVGPVVNKGGEYESYD